MRGWIALFGCAIMGCASLPGEPRWLKASLHVHTNHSDGENDPGDVLRWYADHGYDVVAITDHNRPTTVRAMFEAPAGLLVIPGVEFTSRGGGKPVHVGGLFVMADPTGLDESSPVSALLRMLAFFDQGGALSVVNHPNYGDALSLDDVAQSDARLMEVFNASSGAENDGLAAQPSTEELWDGLLRRGRRVYGIAVDDMHALPGGANANVPGGGFVMIYASPDWVSVRMALIEGSFYASSGPILHSLEATSRRLVAVPNDTPGCAWQLRGNREERLPAGPLALDRPNAGYQRAVYDCGPVGKIFLQPLMP